MVNNKDFFVGAYRPTSLKTGYFYAYEYLVEGLRYFIGDKAQWISEYDQIVDWLKDNHGKGLLCCGSCGLGKTVICERIIPHILNKTKGTDRVCGVMSAYDLGRGAEISWHKGWLVIDDIGVERESVSYGNRQVLFNEIVDKAEKHGDILILTSNLSTDEIHEKYGDRTFERLKAITKVVPFNGESLRGKSFTEGIPERHRAYGVDFDTQEEADAFKKQQDEYYEGLSSGKYERAPKDSDEVFEHQPLKLWHGKLCALMKYDWDKLGE